MTKPMRIVKNKTKLEDYQLAELGGDIYINKYDASIKYYYELSALKKAYLYDCEHGTGDISNYPDLEDYISYNEWNENKNCFLIKDGLDFYLIEFEQIESL